jgi:hypothetical protein
MSKEAALAAATQTAPAPEAAAPPAEAPKPEAPKELDSARFAHLAKQEAKLVKERQELALERERVKEAASKIRQFEDTKSKDPIEALKLIGFTETDIFNYMAGKKDPVPPTPDEIAAKKAEEITSQRLKEWQEQQEKKLQEQTKANDDRLIKEHKEQIGKFLDSTAGSLKHIEFQRKRGEDVEGTIQGIIAQTYAKTGEFLTPDKAAEELEAFYREEFLAAKAAVEEEKKEAEEMAKEVERTSKVTPGFPNEPQPKPVINKTRTLSNAATATARSAAAANRTETREQKRERLMQALRDGVKP